MRRHRVERSIVMGLGFLAGVALAVSITPGDIFLWVATGFVLGLFGHALFDTSYRGELNWPLAGFWRTHKRK